MDKSEKYLMAVLMIICLLLGIISGYHFKEYVSQFNCAEWCNQKLRDANCVCLGEHSEVSEILPEVKT